MSRRRTRGGGGPSDGQAPFTSQWQVRADPKVPPLQVHVPALTMRARYGSMPDLLRLDLRRSGLRGKLTPRPVLRRVTVRGGTDVALAVPAALEPLARGSDDIAVTGASVSAFRWYRLSRSAGQLIGTVASIIGALLVGVGAASPTSDTGKGLLIAGAATTIVAAASLVVSAWRAPVE